MTMSVLFAATIRRLCRHSHSTAPIVRVCKRSAGSSLALVGIDTWCPLRKSNVSRENESYPNGGRWCLRG